jgi:hypothetical protein
MEELVRDVLKTATLQYTRTDPTQRPVLPRRKLSEKIARIMSITNKNILQLI